MNKKISLILFFFIVFLFSCKEEEVNIQIKKIETDVYVGDSIKLEDILIDEELKSQIKWTVDNDKATIDNDGNITFLKSGKVKVTASIKDSSDFIEFDVKEVEIDFICPSIAMVSDIVEYTVEVTNNRQYEIKVLTTDLAEIESNKIIIKKEGTINIEITSGLTSLNFTIIATSKKLDTITNNLSIKNAFLDDTKTLALEFDCNEEEDYITGFGIVYKNAFTNILDFDLSTSNIFSLRTDDKLEKKFFLTINEEDYNKDIYVRLFYTFSYNNEEHIKYASSYKTYNLYEMALESTTSYAQEIVDIVEKRITEIKVKLDTTNYTIEALSDDYDAVIEDTKDFLYITSIITIKEGKKLSSNFVLIVNDVVISRDKYQVNDNVITYSISDPNWSPIV